MCRPSLWPWDQSEQDPSCCRICAVSLLNQDSIDDEDEILLALADELGDFLDYIGGAHYGYLLMNSFENLAAVEETVVREKAIESASKVVAQMPPKHVEEYYIPMLKRLASGDWFTSRTSACGLFAAAYSLCNPATQDEMRKYHVLI